MRVPILLLSGHRRLIEFSLEESSPTMSDRHYVHHHDEVQLARILKESKPWLEKYGTTLIYGLAAVMAVAAVVVYIRNQQPATAEESRNLLVAATPEDFQGVADQTPDSQIGIVARLRQAELSLRDAISAMFTDRKTAVETLDQASVTFERLAERKDISPDIRLRVMVGLARVAETRCDGTDESVSAAVEAWEAVLKESQDSKMFKEVAEDRIKKLPLESTKSFYAWFQTQDPKPGDDLLLPQDGPGNVPDIPRIDIPDFSTPDASSQIKPAPEGDAKSPEGSNPASPTPETPAAPADDKPAPADDKPAPAEGTPEPVPEKSGE